MFRNGSFLRRCYYFLYQLPKKPCAEVKHSTSGDMIFPLPLYDISSTKTLSAEAGFPPFIFYLRKVKMIGTGMQP